MTIIKNINNNNNNITYKYNIDIISKKVKTCWERITWASIKHSKQKQQR